MAIEDLVSISRKYGSNPDFVLAGGGNTSSKNGDELFIKASGFPLSTIDPSGFVRMDRAKLASIWEREYPESRAEREVLALSDLMNARFPGEESKRPSVETLLHDCLDETFVVHTHPALVNGLTCSAGGKKRALELFGDGVLWIPMVDPGYTLARVVRRMRNAYIAIHARVPEFILLENHGIFVSADRPEDIDRTYQSVTETLNKAAKRKPNLDPLETDSRITTGIVEQAFTAVMEKSKADDGATDSVPVVEFAAQSEFDRFLESAESFEPLAHPFTPDHIVYAGHRPLYYDGDPTDDSSFRSALEANIAESGRVPKIAAVRSLGVFGVGESRAKAETAIRLFVDALKVAVYAESHGGHQFLTDEMTEFILDWEVEQSRSKVDS